MLKSMTGFGAAVTETVAYKVSVELKAVNQRFLEISFHMGRQLNPWENLLRECIRNVAARGKMDVYINFWDKRENTVNVCVDKGVLRAYQQALDEISELLHVARPDKAQIFAGFPDVLKVDDSIDISDMKSQLIATMEQALSSFDDMRKTEGLNIKADFQNRLDRLEMMREAVTKIAPGVVTAHREHLRQTVADAFRMQPIDETRLIQEVALYADKVDITEELVRLESHFRQFRQIFEVADEPVGRKLDFLIQEINREANTIGSKASSTEIAQCVVDMKNEIEKLREQVQNIE